MNREPAFLQNAVSLCRKLLLKVQAIPARGVLFYSAFKAGYITSGAEDFFHDLDPGHASHWNSRFLNFGREQALREWLAAGSFEGVYTLKNKQRNGFADHKRVIFKIKTGAIFINAFIDLIDLKKIFIKWIENQSSYSVNDEGNTFQYMFDESGISYASKLEKTGYPNDSRFYSIHGIAGFYKPDSDAYVIINPEVIKNIQWLE